jgi:hypothetical protein
MGVVYAEIELINTLDAGLARRYIIGEEEIRRVRVNSWPIADRLTWLLMRPYRHNWVLNS